MCLTSPGAAAIAEDHVRGAAEDGEAKEEGRRGRHAEALRFLCMFLRCYISVPQMMMSAGVMLDFFVCLFVCFQLLHLVKLHIEYSVFGTPFAVCLRPWSSSEVSVVSPNAPHPHGKNLWWRRASPADDHPHGRA